MFNFFIITIVFYKRTTALKLGRRFVLDGCRFVESRSIVGLVAFPTFPQRIAGNYDGFVKERDFGRFFDEAIQVLHANIVFAIVICKGYKVELHTCFLDLLDFNGCTDMHPLNYLYKALFSHNNLPIQIFYFHFNTTFLLKNFPIFIPRSGYTYYYTTFINIFQVLCKFTWCLGCFS